MRIQKVKLTADYLGGVLAGVGVGFMLGRLLNERFGVETAVLSFPGLMLTCAGSLWVYYRQRQAKGRSSIHRCLARLVRRNDTMPPHTRRWFRFEVSRSYNGE